MGSIVLFGRWPFFAGVVLTGGVLLRYVLFYPSRNSSVQRLSSVSKFLRRHWLLFSGLGLLGCFHLIQFLFPERVLQWAAASWRLYFLEVFLFAVGLAVVCGGIAPAMRFLTAGRRSILSELADAGLFGFLLVSLVSGLLVAALYRWGSVWGSIILVPYLRTALAGHPTIRLVAQMPFLVRLHVLSFFAAVAVFPFSRLGWVAVCALHRFILSVGAPFSVACRGLHTWFQGLNLSSRLWPDED